MTTLINRSNHPVNIKRISVRVWTLREEIESTIAQAIKEKGVEKVDIELLKNFYHSLKPRKFSINNNSNADEDDDLEQNVQPGIEDSSEIPASADDQEEDDEMAAMAQAMQEDSDEGNSEENAQQDDGASDEGSSENTEQESSETSANATSDSAQNKLGNSIKRVFPAQERSTKGFAFLSEVHMDKMLFFDQRPYTRGQSVVIEFLIPNRFTVSAEVTHCMHIERKSKIISETQPTHRIQCDILYLFDGERGKLRDFLKSVEPNIPPSPSQLKRPEAQTEEEDDFDDLGF